MIQVIKLIYQRTCDRLSPAVVAWSVKVLVFNSVNSSPEQGVDQIPSSMVYQSFGDRNI